MSEGIRAARPGLRWDRDTHEYVREPGATIHKPDDIEVTHVVGLHGYGTGEFYFESEEQMAVYRANPDLFAARYYGFGDSIESYYEWLEHEFMPLCGALTRAGKSCKCAVGRYEDAAEFRAKHRIALCAIHRPK